MIFRFGVARCCCDGSPPPTIEPTDSMWSVTWSNTTPPYDEIVGTILGLTNEPTMGVRTNSQGGDFSNGYFFGFSPWYIRDPMDPFNAPFGGWARDNIVLTFRGGGTFAGNPIADLPDDPTTVTLELWLRNTSESDVDYTINAQSFWYPNQTDPDFDGIDPRSPLAAIRDPWSTTAVVASAAAGLPTCLLYTSPSPRD